MASAEPPAVETAELRRTYGEGETEVRALDGVTLRIERGGMVAIMGPSGSGKSTLLHLLGALETPSGGTIAVGGRRFETLGDRELTLLRRETIGFVFQFFNLLPALSAEENVVLPALIAGRRDADHAGVSSSIARRMSCSDAVPRSRTMRPSARNRIRSAIAAARGAP